MSELFYQDYSLGVNDIHKRNWLLGVDVASDYLVTDYDRQARIIGLPLLITSLKVEFACIRNSIISKCRYLLFIRLEDMRKNTVKVNNRLKTLDIRHNCILSMSNTKVSVLNKKSRATTVLPSNLKTLIINENPTFRVTLCSSLNSFTSDFCCELCRVTHKESIIYVSSFLSYRFPKNCQKSIRHYVLMFEEDVIKYIYFGEKGTYNEFPCVTNEWFYV